jgi:hypothetical protein
MNTMEYPVSNQASKEVVKRRRRTGTFNVDAVTNKAGSTRKQAGVWRGGNRPSTIAIEKKDPARKESQRGSLSHGLFKQAHRSFAPVGPTRCLPRVSRESMMKGWMVAIATLTVFLEDGSEGE